MKKLLTLSLLLLSLFLTLPLCASAEEAAEKAPESETVSEGVAAFIEENAEGILGVLTLASSLLVAFLYKTGLLPLLRGGISAISDTAGKTEKLAESFTEEAKEALKGLKDSVAPVGAILEKTDLYLKTVEGALADAKITQEETREILATETALFYELLCSVNLPEEQKDSMRKSYYRLREKLENKP